MEKFIIPANSFDLLFTLRQSRGLANGLDDLLSQLFLTGNDWKVKVEECLGEDQWLFVQSVLHHNSIDLNDLVAVEHALTKTKQQLELVPVVELITGISCPFVVLRNVHRWFRSHGWVVLLDAKVQENLLGGAVVRHAGNNLDFSLRTRMRKSSFDLSD